MCVPNVTVWKYQKSGRHKPKEGRLTLFFIRKVYHYSLLEYTKIRHFNSNKIHSTKMKEITKWIIISTSIKTVHSTLS